MLQDITNAECTLQLKNICELLMLYKTVWYRYYLFQRFNEITTLTSWYEFRKTLFSRHIVYHSSTCYFVASSKSNKQCSCTQVQWKAIKFLKSKTHTANISIFTHGHIDMLVYLNPCIYQLDYFLYSWSICK